MYLSAKNIGQKPMKGMKRGAKVGIIPAKRCQGYG
jgi:hypothetical protein